MHLEKEKVIIISLIALIIVIPLGSFLLAQRAKTAGKNKIPPKIATTTATQPKEIPKDSPLDSIKKGLEGGGSGETTTGGSAADVSFGPTFNFKVNLEGRPVNKQKAAVFLGISEGTVSAKPKYLLTFSINVAEDGSYNGLSLAGLEIGNTYTAYLKGPAQLVKATSFLMKPALTDIGTARMMTGDLNEDNNINTTDYAIAKSTLGSTPNSPNWIANIDFNVDGVINVIDLAFVIRNFGKIGDSGSWFSKPAVASSSAQVASGSAQIDILNPNSSQGGTQLPPIDGEGGYWIWVPSLKIKPGDIL